MAEAGHNSELTPAESKALKFHHFNSILAQKAKVEEQQTEYKRLRKLAKADGIILSDIDFMMKCADVEDETIVTGRIQREAEIAKWFALPISFQPDMFGDIAAEPLEDRAAREGEAAGFRGMEANPPYDASSTAGQAWMKAWHVGNQNRVDALASALEKVGAGKEDGGDELISGQGDDPFADAENLEAAE
jgi:hypothetical protein